MPASGTDTTTPEIHVSDQEQACLQYQSDRSSSDWIVCGLLRGGPPGTLGWSGEMMRVIVNTHQMGSRGSRTQR